MAKHRDKRPVAERIAADIRARIMAGDMPPGMRLPPIATLVDRHGASNVTVQRALTALKTEGLLVGKPGSGVFVREHAPQVVIPAAYIAPRSGAARSRWSIAADDWTGRGSNRILAVGEVPPPARVARALDVPDGQPVVRRQRLGLLDDEPAEVTWSYYPVDLARGTALAERKKIRGGAPAVLAELGHDLVGHADEITARPATTEEYELIEVPGDVPVLEVWRVAWSAFRPVEATVMVKPAHLFAMGYEVGEALDG
ncbi:GntR family transcriptional regulator [Streptomyces chumphonensis]|uniref:GntR family transcriptional regulator n=1 Tax=Streptomyces chumphonensis TaxID=1214925 RepID=UPI003D7283EE